MKSRSRFTLVVFAALAVVPLLPAQSAEERQARIDARQFRKTLVAEVVAGRETSDVALDRLKARRGSSGAGRDEDAEHGLASLDIGQRLLARGRLEQADKFLREAERSLEQAIRRLPAARAADKAMLLRNLAFLRTQYLGKADEAIADLEEAARLGPGDEHTKNLQRALARERGDEIKRQPDRSRR